MHQRVTLVVHHFQSSLGLGPTMGGQYVNGQLTCHFSYIRSKGHGTSGDDSDFLANLSSNEYYLIVAKGAVDENGRSKHVYAY